MRGETEGLDHRSYANVQIVVVDYELESIRKRSRVWTQAVIEEFDKTLANGGGVA
jgi:hypothetical protein